MTSSLNATITDSSPGMAALSTGQKGNNNQEGVFPDNTPDAFDNPRIEYFGELLHRTRGAGFNVGIVTTADVTDSTPGANAVHTSNRYARLGIAARLFDERATNGVTVLIGGGASAFFPEGGGGQRRDARALAAEFQKSGFEIVRNRTDLQATLAAAAPKAVLGLFHPRTCRSPSTRSAPAPTARNWRWRRTRRYRDTPMLDDMTRLALHSLSRAFAEGLLPDGRRRLDRQAGARQDAERVIWDTIEFDHAVTVALEFAGTTNSDNDPDNDTLVIVTADHECGGMAIIGVGNEHYAPSVIGKAMRDYAAMFRFLPEQVLNRSPNYMVDAAASPPIPTPPASCSSASLPAPIVTRTGCPTAWRRWARSSARMKVSVANPGAMAPGRRPTTPPSTARRFRGSWSPAPSNTARTAVPPRAAAPPIRRQRRRPSPGTPRPTCRCRRRAPGNGSSPAPTRTAACC